MELRCFLKKSVVEKTAKMLDEMRRRASALCKRHEARGNEEAAAPWAEEREKLKELLYAFRLVLSEDPPNPHYRPQSQCPAGFEKKAGLRFHEAFRTASLTDSQYTVLCNVCCQALDEMLVGFDKNLFWQGARLLQSAVA